MLTLSRPDSFSGSVCDIKKLLSASAKDVESLGKKKGLSCLLRMADLPSSLPLPGDNVKRILANLTDNAVQYSPVNGTIYVDACLADNTFVLRIRDEGEGFSKKALAFATTEFYRGDESRSSKEHFGLGLFIARQIVTQAGGTLRLENAPEKGALITVNLPLPSEKDCQVCL
jgi:signal transduction histidine kinase